MFQWQHKSLTILIHLIPKIFLLLRGGACSFWGATAAVGVGAVGGAVKGGIQTGTWQGAALKGIGYGIKGGITYGLTCRY